MCRCLSVLVPMLCVLAGVGMSCATDDDAIVYYDMTPLGNLNLNDPVKRRQYYDETHFVVSLQGLANRDAPRLYLRYVRDPDDFWWARMTEPGGWLHGRNVVTLHSIDALLDRFAAFYEGVVVWDERVPATVNLASTIAGCENLLCIRYDPTPDSLYQRIVDSGRRLPVRKRLLADDGSPLFPGTGTIAGTEIRSSSSAKCDAYLWLAEHYVRSGTANPTRMGYYLDAYWLSRWNAGGRRELHTLTNHDFVIARRGVLFDLNVWDDESPVDDPGQPAGADAATLRTLLRAMYDREQGRSMIHVAGFVPWAFKYTNWGSAGGHHEPVPTEWRYAEILSSFNGFMDADAIGLSAMANASFFQHYPLQAYYPQNPKPTEEALVERGIIDADGNVVQRYYIAHYVGDYDAAAWLYQMAPTIWNDVARGQEVLSWAFNPNLCERFPLGMAWTRATRTPNDFFVAGNSGAGYVNVGHVQASRVISGLPSGLPAWEAHCRQFYEQWDISLTGFLIDGYAPCMGDAAWRAYARFSPDGVIPQKCPTRGVFEGMPFLRMVRDLSDNAGTAAGEISTYCVGPQPRFLVFRSILKSPSWYVGVNNAVRSAHGDNVIFVDLYTLLWLVRRFERQPQWYSDSPYADVTSVWASPSVSTGLRTVVVADGPVNTTMHSGVLCWRVAARQYLYFDADDAFQPRKGEALEFTVEYWDGGTSRPHLQYDSDDRLAGGCGVYKDHPPAPSDGQGQWRTHHFRPGDAQLRNSQNNGADFRLYAAENEMLVRKVVVTRAPAPGIQLR